MDAFSCVTMFNPLFFVLYLETCLFLSLRLCLSLSVFGCKVCIGIQGVVNILILMYVDDSLDRVRGRSSSVLRGTRPRVGLFLFLSFSFLFLFFFLLRSTGFPRVEFIRLEERASFPLVLSLLLMTFFFFVFGCLFSSYSPFPRFDHGCGYRDRALNYKRHLVGRLERKIRMHQLTFLARYRTFVRICVPPQMYDHALSFAQYCITLTPRVFLLSTLFIVVVLLFVEIDCSGVLLDVRVSFFGALSSFSHSQPLPIFLPPLPPPPLSCCRVFAFLQSQRNHELHRAHPLGHVE